MTPMKRLFPAIVLLVAVGCGTTTQTAPSQNSSAIGAPDSRTGAQLKTQYVDAVCKLYTEPECVASQKTSCPSHIAFPDKPACAAFMKQAASSCDGLEAALAANHEAVDMCTAQLSAMQCGNTPVCSAGVRIDTVQDCAPVQALIAACDKDEDTGI